ncbi:MAG: LysR family transcriptional regulator, partial [Mesorhizobium sp.]
MAETVNELARKLSGQDLRFEGTLRVTTTDTLMVSVLPPILAAFRDLHPGIRVEATTQNSIANLTHRDADVAIRPVSQPPEILIGRRISGVAFAAYAARSYIETLPPEPTFSGLRWIAPDDSLANTGVARWM